MGSSGTMSVCRSENLATGIQDLVVVQGTLNPQP